MKKNLALIGLCLIIASCSGKKDLERMSFLKAGAFEINRDRVIAYFPKDSLSEKRMNEIVDTLNLGITLANKFIDNQSDRRVYKDKKLTYYFCPGYFVSHTSESGEIFIPFWRIKENRAPWLHETMHILLRSDKGYWNPTSSPMNYLTMPMWFTEGMAEYLAMKISYENHLPKADLFESGGYNKVDSVCRISLQKKIGPYILRHIGETGIIVKLFGKKRGKYAPTFYNCSCSFTKYLTETYGLDKMLNAIYDYKNEQKTIERLTKKTIKGLKEEWLTRINHDYKTTKK